MLARLQSARGALARGAPVAESSVLRALAPARATTRRLSGTPPPPSAGAPLSTADRAWLVAALRADSALAEDALAQLPEQARRRLLGQAMSEMEAEFARADADKDGRISWREFASWGKALAHESGASMLAPSGGQLCWHFLRSGLPFVGFGFVDNGLMVITGEAIDSTLGVALGISTLAAAALGNACSNVVGIGAHGTIEKLVNRLGVPDPKLSAHQRARPAVHMLGTLGGAVGVFVGCVLGMLPLFFMNKERDGDDEKADGAAGQAS